MTDKAEGHPGEPIDADFEPAEPGPRARRGRRRGVGLGTVLAASAAAAVGGGAIGALAPREPAVARLLDQAVADPGLKLSVEHAALKAEVEALKKDRAIADLQQRLAAFETAAVTPLVSAAGEDAALPPTTFAARVFGLQNEVDALETRLAAAATAEQVQSLTQELAALRADFAGVAEEASRAARAAAAAYAVSAATEAARSAGSFEPAYAALASLLPEDPNVKALAPYAKDGAPTAGELKEQFRGLELSIVRAARIAEAGGGFVGRVQAWLANFIVVRRTGAAGVSSADSTDIVARASARIEAEDLAGAARELATLSGPPAQVAAPWLAQAKARVEIDARLALLRAELARGSASPS